MFSKFKANQMLTDLLRHISATAVWANAAWHSGFIATFFERSGADIGISAPRAVAAQSASPVIRNVIRARQGSLSLK
jgi:hypothetical protein